MAIYKLHVKMFGRNKGNKVTSAAAYRAGECIRDVRRSTTYDFSERDDVVYKEILLPGECAGRAEYDWARDRATLWNTAENTEYPVVVRARVESPLTDVGAVVPPSAPAEPIVVRSSQEAKPGKAPRGATKSGAKTGRKRPRKPELLRPPGNTTQNGVLPSDGISG